MGPAATRTTPATSRTSWRGWRSRWPRPRSPGCCGSRGTRSGRSSSGSSPITSTSGGCDGLVAIGVRRDLLPPRAAVPDQRRRPPLGRDRVVRPGPQRRHLAGVLRSARRSQGLDPGGLDRHVRRLPASDPRATSPTPRSASTRSTSCASRQRAVDQVRRDEWNAHERSHTPEGQMDQGHPLVAAQEPRQADHRPARASSAKSSRPTSRSTAPSCSRRSSGCSTTSTTPRSRPRTSTPGSTWASRSRLEPFVKLARTIRRHRDGILAAIRLGLNNGRLEGLNSRIRLISHRSFGFHSAGPLIALIYLCCTGIVIPLPR